MAQPPTSTPPTPTPPTPTPPTPTPPRPTPPRPESNAGMLFIIMASLVVVFLGGLGIILGVAPPDEFESADIVAIISPALALIGAVAGGVLGYSLGTRGAAEAQQATGKAREELGLVRATASRLDRATERITTQGLAGNESQVPGHRDISEEDLRTLRADADALADSLSRTP